MYKHILTLLRSVFMSVYVVILHRFHPSNVGCYPCAKKQLWLEKWVSTLILEGCLNQKSERRLHAT